MIFSPLESWIVLIAIGINIYYFIKYVIFTDNTENKGE